MATKKKIKKYNDEQFFVDLKKATSVMVYAKNTRDHFSILKKELLEAAESRKISYLMTNTIFKVGRIVMVII